ncbi:MAG: class I SAM-dependent methyltransferase [Chloroflexi bacterium]|nr:class I SAM-dependent methyltransferase [Chloroflexota bacterium]
MSDLPEQNEKETFGPVDDYNPFAYYYDLFYQKITSDLGFYQTLAQQAGTTARILELACGAGRLFIPLLKAGLSITGLDLSVEMLELARKKLETETDELKQRLRLIQGDMRNLDEVLETEEFDLIILGFNSFSHLLLRNDQLACLRSAQQHLAPNGLFVIMVSRPTVNPEAPDNKRLQFLGSFPNPPRKSAVSLLVNTTEYVDKQECHTRYCFYEELPDGTTERLVIPITQHYFYPEELRLLLEEAGFTITHFYGSYQLEEFNNESTKIIYLCRRS